MLKREVYVKNIYTDGEIHTAARNIQLFLLMLTDKSELQACMRNCKVVWLVVKCISAIPYLLFLSVRALLILINLFIRDNSVFLRWCGQTELEERHGKNWFQRTLVAQWLFKNLSKVTK